VNTGNATVPVAGIVAIHPVALVEATRLVLSPVTNE
jgi:hypothetical protein